MPDKADRSSHEQTRTIDVFMPTEVQKIGFFEILFHGRLQRSSLASY